TPILTATVTETASPDTTVMATASPDATPQESPQPSGSGTAGAAGTPGGPPSAAQPSDATPPEAASLPWDVFVHAAALQSGRIRFVHRVVEAVETTELELTGITPSGFELRPGGEHTPREGAIELHLGDGSVKITTDLTMREGGIAANAK